jgi:nucleoid-associated protein YgaU/uncharacterized protein YukE
MGLGADLKAILDPDCDPAVIHEFAAACRTLAAELDQTRSAGNGAVTTLMREWKGTGPDSASAKFLTVWNSLSTAVDKYAATLDKDAAPGFDNLADEMNQVDTETRRMYETAIATIAAGAALTLLTAALSDAAAAAAVATDIAVDGAEIGRFTELLLDATKWIRQIIAFLSEDPAVVFDRLLTYGLKVGVLGLAGGGESVITEMITTALDHKNPFNLANYSAADVTNIELGAVLTMVLGTAANNVPFLQAALNGNIGLKLASNAAYGALGSTTGSVIAAEAQDKSISLKTVGESAAISAVSNMFMAGVGGPIIAKVTGAGGVGDGEISGVGEPFGTKVSAALKTELNLPSSLRIAAGLPAAIAGFKLNYGAKTAGPATPGAPAAIPAGAAPPVAHPAPPAPTTYTVQSGDTLTQIAGGNAQKAAEIAQLNGLPDDGNLILPGQVLKLPSGS